VSTENDAIRLLIPDDEVARTRIQVHRELLQRRSPATGVQRGLIDRMDQGIELSFLGHLYSPA
jgi:hypothetical protein